jgi:hypothetical protein
MNVPIIGRYIDERFLTHRLRSTSLAGMAGVLFAFGLFLWNLLGKHQIRWDLFALIAVMAAVKMSAMIWFRMHD